MRGSSRITAVVAVILGFAVSACAEAKKAPSDEAIATALENAMTPGEGQKKLDSLVGTFDAKIRTWATPSSPPTEDSAVMVSNWVLGGRYVHMVLTGNVLGEPYEGIGYAGFDNTTKKHVATFMDSSSTGMEWYTGGFDDATVSQATLKGSIASPVTGEASPVEMRLTLDAAGNHVTELWGEGLGHEMFKMIEIRYTKRAQ